MKKIRAYITVDLNVADNFDPQKELAVVQYGESLGGNETYLPKSDSFEVEEYVDININTIEETK